MWSRLCFAKARRIVAGVAFALVSMAGMATPSMADDLTQDFGLDPSLRRRRLEFLLGRAA